MVFTILAVLITEPLKHFFTILLCVIVVFASTFAQVDEAVIEKHLAQGNEYLSKRNYRLAAIQFEKVIELDNTNAQGYYGYGQTFHKQNDLGRALFNYVQSKKWDPEYGYAYYGMGKIMTEKEDFSKAVENLKRALSLDNEIEDAYVQLGLCYIKTNKNTEAINILSQLLKLNDENADAHYLKGLVFEASDNQEAAIAASRKAVELNPEYRKAYKKLAQLYYEQEDYENVIATANEAIYMVKDDPELYYMLGIAYDEIEESDLALTELRKGYRLSKSNKQGITRLGNIYFNRGIFAEAIKYYNQAGADANPKFYLKLARSYAGINNEKLAFEFLEKVELSNSNGADYAIVQATIALNKDSVNQAKVHLENSLKYNKENYNVWMLLAELNYGQEDYPATIRNAKEALVLNENIVEAYTLIINCYRSMDQKDKASEYALEKGDIVDKLAGKTEVELDEKSTDKSEEKSPDKSVSKE